MMPSAGQQRRERVPVQQVPGRDCRRREHEGHHRRRGRGVTEQRRGVAHNDASNSVGNAPPSTRAQNVYVRSVVSPSLSPIARVKPVRAGGHDGRARVVGRAHRRRRAACTSGRHRARAPRARRRPDSPPSTHAIACSRRGRSLALRVASKKGKSSTSAPPARRRTGPRPAGHRTPVLPITDSLPEGKLCWAFILALSAARSSSTRLSCDSSPSLASIPRPPAPRTRQLGLRLVEGLEAQAMRASIPCPMRDSAPPSPTRLASRRAWPRVPAPSTEPRLQVEQLELLLRLRHVALHGLDQRGLAAGASRVSPSRRGHLGWRRAWRASSSSPWRSAVSARRCQSPSSLARVSTLRSIILRFHYRLVQVAFGLLHLRREIAQHARQSLWTRIGHRIDRAVEARLLSQSLRRLSSPGFLSSSATSLPLARARHLSAPDGQVPSRRGAGRAGPAATTSDRRDRGATPRRDDGNARHRRWVGERSRSRHRARAARARARSRPAPPRDAVRGLARGRQGHHRARAGAGAALRRRTGPRLRQLQQLPPHRWPRTSTPAWSGLCRERGRKIKVEVARELAARLKLAPGPRAAAHRAGDIHPRRPCTDQATNALLKTLEEPNPGVYFVALAQALSMDILADDIRRRCAIVRFGRADDADVAATLADALAARGEAAPVPDAGLALTRIVDILRCPTPSPPRPGRLSAMARWSAPPRWRRPRRDRWKR